MAAEHEGNMPEHADADSTQKTEVETNPQPKEVFDPEAKVNAEPTTAMASSMEGDVEPTEVAIEALLPQRRKAASEDGASENEEEDAFHDAEGEGESQEAGNTQQEEDQELVQDKPVETRPASEAEDDEANRQHAVVNSEDGDLQQEKAKPREPYDVPTSGAFWLHDDRFGEQLDGQQQKGGRKHRSEVEGRWAHDRFNADDDIDGTNEGRSYARGRGRGRGGGRGRGRRSSPHMQSNSPDNREDYPEQPNSTLPAGTAAQGSNRAPMTVGKGRSIPRGATSSDRGRGASQLHQQTSGRGRGTATRRLPTEQSHDRTPFAGDFGGEFSRQSARHGQPQGNGSAPGRGSSTSNSSRLPQPSFTDADRKPRREPPSWQQLQQQQQQQQQVASGSRRYTHMSGAGRGEGVRNRPASHRAGPGRGGNSRDEVYEESGLAKRLSANAQEYHPPPGGQKRTQTAVGNLSATAQEFAPTSGSPGRPSRTAQAHVQGKAGPQPSISQDGSAPTAEDMANFMKQFQAMMPYMQSFLASQAGQPATASPPSSMPAAAAADTSIQHQQYQHQAAQPTQHAAVTQTLTQPQSVQQQSPSQQQQQAADMQQWIQQAMTHAMAQGQSQEQAWTTVQTYLSQLQQQQHYQLQLQQQQQQHTAQLQYQAMPDQNAGAVHMQQPVQYQDARYAANAQPPVPQQQQHHAAQVQDALLSTGGRRFTANRRA